MDDMQAYINQIYPDGIRITPLLVSNFAILTKFKKSNDEDNLRVLKETALPVLVSTYGSSHPALMNLRGIIGGYENKIADGEQAHLRFI
jgi:hypothetical protein